MEKCEREPFTESFQRLFSRCDYGTKGFISVDGGRKLLRLLHEWLYVDDDPGPEDRNVDPKISLQIRRLQQLPHRVRKMVHEAGDVTLAYEDSYDAERRHRNWKRVELENDLVDLFQNVKCMVDVGPRSKEFGARAVISLIESALVFFNVAGGLWKLAQATIVTTSPPPSSPSPFSSAVAEPHRDCTEFMDLSGRLPSAIEIALEFIVRLYGGQNPLLDDEETYIWDLLQEGLAYDVTRYDPRGGNPGQPDAWVKDRFVSSLDSLREAVIAQDEDYEDEDPWNLPFLTKLRKILAMSSCDKAAILHIDTDTQRDRDFYGICCDNSWEEYQDPLQEKIDFRFKAQLRRKEVVESRFDTVFGRE